MRNLLLLLLAIVVLSGTISCKDLSGDESAVADVVYLCRETNEMVTAPPQTTPAVNPRTGRPTLVRGLYCEKCRKWRAVPPRDVYAGNPLSWPCPRHRQPMSPDGPLPAGGIPPEPKDQ